MAKIKEITNMLLGEIAPYVDEALAVKFAEIENDPYLSPAEKQEAKRISMSAITKGIVGGAGLVGMMK